MTLLEALQILRQSSDKTLIKQALEVVKKAAFKQQGGGE